ncbi:hypothetical protein JOD97_002830 [Duganella sp. 1411]|uniref:hypothetical protein n=1 Tax=Duganella sp. 1411 TaxID=2806572 RepID=UPI001AE60B47|nr:hypothetical protein [Duganella sp. 1411]MBP1204788.1 hypothetical protein [Duganella sp. 1411]
MTKTGGTSSIPHRSIDIHNTDVLPDPRSAHTSPATSPRGGKGASSSGGQGVLSKLTGWMTGNPKRAGGGSPRAKGKLPETSGGGGGGSASSPRRSESSSSHHSEASSESFYDAHSSFRSDSSDSFVTAPSSPIHSPPPSPRHETRPPPPPAPLRNVADVASGLRHPHPMKESTQKSTWFGRQRVTPGKGMQLPISGEALAKAPASQRGTPGQPGVSNPLAKGLLNSEHHKMQKTMRNAVTQIAPDVPKPAMNDRPAESMAALGDRGAMEAHIAQMFPAGGVHTKLSAALEHDAGGAAPTSFPYTNHVLVSEDLAAACGGDAARAEAALDVLSSGPAMEQMLHALDAGALSGASLDALHTATKLASTPAGFNAMMTMMQPPPAAARQPGLRRLLTAAGKVASEGAAAGLADPLADCGKRAALKVAVTPARATLAEKVLTIEMRVHKAAPPAEGVSPYAALSPAEKTSVFTWKQGFHDSGPGTTLSKAQGRLAKMGKYVARAAKHEKNASASFDRAHPLKNGKFIKARARMTAASVNQVFGKKKSPLSPMRSMGVNNAAQLHPDDNITNLDAYVGSAMGELRAKLAETAPRAGSLAHTLMVSDLADPRTALPPAIERAALMKYLQDPSAQAQPRRPLGNAFDADALAMIAAGIAADHGTPEAAPAIAAKLSHWNGRSVTLPDLRQWGRDCGLAESTPTAHAEGGEALPGQAPTLTQETAFGKALRQAANVVDPASFRPAAMTADGAHQYVRTFIQEASWGNVVTAGSGGAVGLNVAPVTIGLRKLAGKITGLFSGGAVRGAAGPIADVRGVRSHNAQISFGTSHHGGELFLGTQKQGAGALGGGFGASIRAGFGKILSAGGGGSATVTPLAGDKGYTRGVMVRTSRPENPDGKTFNSALARDDMVRFVDFMFGMAKAEGGEHQAPDQAWEKIANEFFDSDTLSIGWHNQSAETLRHTATASANVRAGVVAHDKPFESVGAAITGTISTDWASAANNKRTEEGGAFRMVRNNHMERFQINGQVSASITNPAIPVDSGDPSHPPLHIVPPDGPPQMIADPGEPTSEALNFAPPLLGKQANYSLVDKGMNVTFRAIIEDGGRLSETYTLREVEHRDAGHFKAMLQEPSRRAQYEKVFEAVHGAERAGPELDAFIQKLDNWKGPGQHYSMRSRIRTDVRKGLDESAALATTIHRRNPDDPRLAQISAHMMAQLNDERSWVPMQIQAFEAQAASDVAGLNFGIVATSNFAVASDRELYATAAPPDVIRAWADMPPAAPVHPEGA